MKHRCSYCGGYEVPDNPKEPKVETAAVMTLEDAEAGKKRDVCIRCLMKVMDTVLGKPKEEQ